MQIFSLKMEKHEEKLEKHIRHTFSVKAFLSYCYLLINIFLTLPLCVGAFNHFNAFVNIGFRIILNINILLVCWKVNKTSL